MLLDFFLRGVVLSVYIVVPIGAISILYIKRTLQNGVASGVVSAFGVTTVETFYASCAIYGLNIVSDFLLKYEFWLQLFGTLFLVIFGFRILLSKARIRISKRSKKQGLISDYISMVIITSVNPLTLVGFIAIFVSFGVDDVDGKFYHSLAILIGFLFSSFSYCLLLILTAHGIKNRFFSDDRDLIQIISKMSGLVIILFTISAFILSLIENTR